MNKRERMQEQIRQHGERLLAIFPNAEPKDPDKLCRKLHRLETQGQRLAEQWCNGEIDETLFDDGVSAVIIEVDKILRFSTVGVPVFFNSDPRGYALKIDDRYVSGNDLLITTDWGGYGIICPEFDGN